jgi:hypothetical protein
MWLRPLMAGSGCAAFREISLLCTRIQTFAAHPRTGQFDPEQPYSFAKKVGITFELATLNKAAAILLSQFN